MRDEYGIERGWIFTSYDLTGGIMRTVIWNGVRYEFSSRHAMRRFIMRRVFGSVNA